MPAWLGPAISAGAGLLGGALGGGGGQGKVRAMDSVPGELHEDYLGLAKQVNDLQTPTYYGGQLIADMYPGLASSIQGATGFANNNPFAAGLLGAGAAGIGGIGAGMDHLDYMRWQGPQQFQFDQGTFDQTMANLAPGLQNTFDFGAGQIQQNFDWNVLPGLNMANALGGGSGSTKFGQTGALGQAMANQNIQQFGTNLWQNAANQAQQAGMTGGLQNLAQQNTLDQQLLGGYGQFGQLGLAGLNYGQNALTQGLDLGLRAGGMQQTYDQSLIDAQMRKHNFEQQAPWIALQSQLGMLPSPGGAQPGVPGMSPWEGALQGAQAGLGLWDAWQDATT